MQIYSKNGSYDYKVMLEKKKITAYHTETLRNVKPLRRSGIVFQANRCTMSYQDGRMEKYEPKKRLDENFPLDRSLVPHLSEYRNYNSRQNQAWSNVENFHFVA